MSKPLVFDTPVDRYIRSTGMTRREFARQALLSTSTVLKTRALDPRRGRIHWTSLVLIGVQMGLIDYNEFVDEHDNRLRAIAGTLISTRGHGAPNFANRPAAVRRHLKAVA